VIYSGDVIILRLDKLLKARGLSAYRLAQESGIHPSVLLKYRHNEVREISVDTLDALCKALHCQPGDLIAYVRGVKAKKAAK
jgi:putative transcriptional regulator